MMELLARIKYLAVAKFSGNLGIFVCANHHDFLHKVLS